MDVDAAGRVRIRLQHAGKDTAWRTSATSINDGRWHHVIAEVDRTVHSEGIRMYVDGRLNQSNLGGQMPSKNASLSNDADFLVGKGPESDLFAGAMEFLRIARGTLADAETTIDELYAWQFDGPFLRDFAGKPTEDRRDAGAIEAARQ
jgi:hypothetical protein